MSATKALKGGLIEGAAGPLSLGGAPTIPITYCEEGVSPYRCYIGIRVLSRFIRVIGGLALNIIDRVISTRLLLFSVVVVKSGFYHHYFMRIMVFIAC